MLCFFFSSRRRHTRWTGDWSSDVCSSDLLDPERSQSRSSPRTQRSYRSLEEASHRIRLEMVTKEQGSKQTKRTYQRHYNSYISWWDAWQEALVQNDPTGRPLPALPITAA